MPAQDFYNDLYREHGPELSALGWSSLQAQTKRFNVLSSVITVPGRVLDVGCGFGDFANRFNKDDYIGIDSNADFIAEAQRRNPTKTFIHGDFMQTQFDRFDYVIANGVLAFQDNPIGMVKRMWSYTDRALAFTWLKTTLNDINLAITSTDCEWFAIRRDYIPDDHAIFMYRTANESPILLPESGYLYP